MNNREFYEYIFRGGGKQIVTTLPDGVNRQFSTADLDTAYEYVAERGKTENVYLNPNPRREDLPLGVRGSDDDIIMVNAFVADVDVLGLAHKELNLPPTKQDAMEVLNSLPKQPSVIVDSGYGLYAYYLFKNPIDTTEEETRKYVATIYKGFGKHMTGVFAKHGWKLDQVFNLSHMYRAPGSLNHKLNSGKPECRVIVDNGIFYTLEDFENFYEEPVMEHTAFEVDERVVGSADRIMDGCKFAHKLLEEPNAVTEPEWKAALSNIALAKDGAEKSHEWSSLYAGYSYEETEAKVQQCQRAKKPCTCSYIKSALGFQCPEGGCGVKAPVVFTLLSKEEQIRNIAKEEHPTIEYLFDPYVIKLLPYAKEHCPVEYSKIKAMAKLAGIGLRDFEKVVKLEVEKQTQSLLDDFDMEPAEIVLKGMDTNGAMTPKGYRISDKNGVEVVRVEEGIAFCENLCSEPLIISKRTENVDNGTEKYELAYRRNHKWKKIVASRSTVLNKNKIIQYADYGVPVSSDNAEGVVRYIGAYEAENEKRIPFVRSTDRIGWMGKEFFPYVMDGEVLYENNEGTELIDGLKEKGSLDVWMEMAGKLRQETFARVILAASFVSPLLELLQMRVIILHLWHSSRSGKTAILKFALSIWGDPLKLMGNFNSTAVGLERRAGTLKHLPLGLDELQVLLLRLLNIVFIQYPYFLI